MENCIWKNENKTLVQLNKTLFLVLIILDSGSRCYNYIFRLKVIDLVRAIKKH